MKVIAPSIGAKGTNSQSPRLTVSPRLITKLPTRERDLTGGRNAQEICARTVMVRRAYPEGRSDAHCRCGDFDNRNGFDGGAGSGPDV
jgi:hypothetical protein